MGKLLIVGSLAFDSIETPFGKTEKTMGGAYQLHQHCGFTIYYRIGGGFGGGERLSERFFRHT